MSSKHNIGAFDNEIHIYKRMPTKWACHKNKKHAARHKKERKEKKKKAHNIVIGWQETYYLNLF